MLISTHPQQADLIRLSKALTLCGSMVLPLWLVTQRVALSQAQQLSADSSSSIIRLETCLQKYKYTVIAW